MSNKTTAIHIKDESEFKRLMEIYESRGWKYWKGRQYWQHLPYVIFDEDPYLWCFAEKDFTGKIISFDEFLTREGLVEKDANKVFDSVLSELESEGKIKVSQPTLEDVLERMPYEKEITFVKMPKDWWVYNDERILGCSAHGKTPLEALLALEKKLSNQK